MANKRNIKDCNQVWQQIWGHHSSQQTGRGQSTTNTKKMLSESSLSPLSSSRPLQHFIMQLFFLETSLYYLNDQERLISEAVIIQRCR